MLEHSVAFFEHILMRGPVEESLDQCRIIFCRAKKTTLKSSESTFILRAATKYDFWPRAI